MTSPTFLRRRVRALLPIALLGAAALTPAASAADAPSRTIARDTAGSATSELIPAAVSNDGRTVVGTLAGRAVIRDVAAGTTTYLLDAGSSVLDASTDLRYVLVDTRATLSAADTDGTPDAYLLDRTTGAFSLVTGVSKVMSTGATADVDQHDEYQLSGDGRTVAFRTQLIKYAADFTTPTSEYTVWRWSAATSALTKVANGDLKSRFVTITHTDDAGNVTITDDAALVGGRTVPLPMPTTDYARATVAVSADGSAIAVAVPPAPAFGSPSTVSIVTTATGASATVTIPSWLVTNGYALIGVANGGASVLVRATVKRTNGLRSAIGSITRAGVLSQIGGDVLVPPSDVRPLVLSENQAFAANNLVLAQLGTEPLPGAEPPAAAAPPITKYLSYSDTSCAQQPFGGVTYTRAAIALAAVAQGADLRTPSSATIRVFNTATPTTMYNLFTLAAGKSRALTVPRTGGWSFMATLTFTDGSKLSGTVSVPAHPVEPCQPFYWF